MKAREMRTEKRHGVLVATVTGAVGAPRLRKIRQDICEQELTAEVHAVLLDLRKASLRMDILEILEVAESHKDVFPAGFPCALVYSARTQSPPFVLFAEEVISRQGGNFRVFAGAEQATQWLNSAVRPRQASSGESAGHVQAAPGVSGILPA